MGAAIQSSLLILQDRDMRVQRIEADLARLPSEREQTRKKISNCEASIEEGRQRIKELEVQSKAVETEMGEVESQVLKYKNQQLQVKKNEEYQALTHEIENAQKKISELEEKELELLYELDDARKAQKAEELDLDEKIKAEKSFLSRLDEKEENLKQQIEEARADFAEAEGELDRPMLSKYKQVARGIKYPIIVLLRDQKCGGCHMRVSAAVEFELKKGEESTTCDNCGRILYLQD